MAGTFSQIYIQVVFAVRGRENLLSPTWRHDIFEYMAGIIRAKQQKVIIVNEVADHVHIFFGMRPIGCLSDLVRDVKNNSSRRINERKLVPGKFEWQEGYGAFSYSQSHMGKVYDYILNQEKHHRRLTFRQDYEAMLKKFNVEHDGKYLFDWIE
jgi:REP element-mobilizing transposase RayT